MSSTDAGAVFDRDIVPAAAARRREPGTALPLAADPVAQTYLTTRLRRVLSRADFEWPVVATPEELRARLMELWAGDPTRLRLVEPLLQLARIPDAGDAPAPDVPDHLYPMY